jgi:glycerol-3-phosphate dehydrogenase
MGSVDDAQPKPASRAALFERLARSHQWDLAVIGGGATGLGIALDAAARGQSVVLIESHDFAKGTSSRSTKLLHGGVRYLAQGKLRLVCEAMRERSVILRNAPHLANRLAFLVPAYSMWDMLKYGVGLTAYACLAGNRSLGNTAWLGPKQTLHALPSLRREGLKGGIRYWDAQFDDARLAIALARTAAAHDALVLNYCEAVRVQHVSGKVSGLICRDQETGNEYKVRARCVINATGVWVDSVRRTEPTEQAPARGDLCSSQRDQNFVPKVMPSRGAHIVLDASFLPSGQALMVPSTSDGRVLFAIPWLGKLLVGTTDTATLEATHEPLPTADEIAFILRELGRYLESAPTAKDVLSAWAGLRPLVKPPEQQTHTKSVSREHDIAVSESGLVTVTGGKWTTYRVIADEALEACMARGLMNRRTPCRTEHLLLVGATRTSIVGRLRVYGSEADRAASMPGADRLICPELTEGMVRFAARYEYARTVEDVLARRSRLLFLDARKAASCAETTANILREELGNDPKSSEFIALANQYAAPSQDKDCFALL